MTGRLIERDAEGRSEIHPVTENTLTIGRASDNRLVVDREGISRHHAELRWDGDRYLLVDLGSKNGTWLNGRRVSAPEPLHHGDLLTLPGRPAFQLRFEDDSTTATVDLASVLAADQRLQPPPDAVDEQFRIDRRTAELWVRGRSVKLTAKEYLALTVLADAEGGLVSKQSLAEQVWPEYQGVVGDENIEQLIFRVRHKLGVQPDERGYLQTVRGLGYRLHTR